MGVTCGGAWANGSAIRAVYSREKIIETLMEADPASGMTYEEAEEFFEFNVAGAYIPDGPVYVETGLKKP